MLLSGRTGAGAELETGTGAGRGSTHSHASTDVTHANGKRLQRVAATRIPRTPGDPQLPIGQPC